VRQPMEAVQQPPSTQRTQVSEDDEWAEPAILRFLREN
jgi:hypothetical protein